MVVAVPWSHCDDCRLSGYLNSHLLINKLRPATPTRQRDIQSILYVEGGGGGGAMVMMILSAALSGLDSHDLTGLGSLESSRTCGDGSTLAKTDTGCCRHPRSARPPEISPS